MRCWLDHVLANVTPAGLVAWGFKSNDADLLLRWLQTWCDELPANNTAAVPVSHSPIGEGGFPLFDYTVDTAPAALRLMTELPVHNDYVLVSSLLLNDPEIRVIGSMRGSSDLASKGANLVRPSGTDLASDLGITNRGLSVSYMNVDRLFTPRLTLLSTTGLSEDWQGLVAETEQQVQYLLFPFVPEVLGAFSAEELSARTRAKFAAGSFKVDFWFGPDTVDWHASEQVIKRNVASRTYADSPTSGQGVYDAKTLNEQIDVRVYPNINLRVRAVVDGHTDYLVRRPEDRRYYVRVRRSPFWSFRVETLTVDDDGRHRRHGGASKWSTVSAAWRLNGQGGAEQPQREQRAKNCSEYVALDPPEYPVGFSVEGNGLSLCRFRSSIQDDAQARVWDVAVDFGTSNTCIAYNEGNGARLLEIPALTSILHHFPKYSVSFNPPENSGHGKVTERAAATLDFFPRYSPGDEFLSREESFPTQFVTPEPRPLTKDTEGFHPGNGNAYFQNLTLDDWSVTSSVNEFPRLEELGGTVEEAGRATVMFDNRDRLKWPTKFPDGSFDRGDTIWRASFMASFRTTIILAAASKGARVRSVRFSYPWALPADYAGQYRNILRSIWAPEFNTANVPITESEAVRNWLMTQAHQDEHVVFDIGGATTDILGIYDAQPFFQASELFAGGQINEYVLASCAFRAALLTVCKACFETSPFEKLEKLLAGAWEPKFVQHAWFGLLRLMRPQKHFVFSKLRTEYDIAQGQYADQFQPQDAEMRKRAVRGFFLSLTELFGEMAFLAGRLMRLRLDESEDARNRGFVNLQMHLLGNGAWFSEWLDSDGDPLAATPPFGRIMLGLFHAGLEFNKALDKQPPQGWMHFAGIPLDAQNRLLSKSPVVLGLLSGGQSAAALPVSGDTADITHYSGINTESHITPEFPDDIRVFLERLDWCLSQEKPKTPIIPFGPKRAHRLGGVFEELQSVYRQGSVRAFVSDNERNDAISLKQAGTDSGDPANPARSGRLNQPLYRSA